MRTATVIKMLTVLHGSQRRWCQVLRVLRALADYLEKLAEAPASRASNRCRALAPPPVPSSGPLCGCRASGLKGSDSLLIAHRPAAAGVRWWV